MRGNGRYIEYSGLRKGLTSYGDPDFSLFLRKTFIKAMGYSDDALDRPIVGITNTFSDYNPCHGNVPRLIDAVKRGVMLSGGLPLEFPTISIHESFAHPTSMFLRNLMAMDTEEMIRSQPMDAVVLIGGCDKTVPAQLMAGASADIPAIQLVTGPMLVGHYKGEILGACTDCRRLWARHRIGELEDAEVEILTERLAPTQGTCMVMGTASTMGCLAESLGIALSGTSTIPATHADRFRCAEATGRRAVGLAAEELRPRKILTKAAFHNAMVVLQAIGGSTNAVIHLAAIAGRCGIHFDLDELDMIGRKVPVMVNLKPSGAHYMEDLHWAGGIPTLLRKISDYLDVNTLTVDGGTLADSIARAVETQGQEIIHSRACPVTNFGAIAVLRGNLAPRGAVIKQSAASPELLLHTGRAIVFDSVDDMTSRIDDPDLDVHEEDILILRNAGPKGAPGMPEAGYIPIPKKLARVGVSDMVRISDARMSGTAFGTIILHVSPEAAAEGPLAVVRNGDVITLDVAQRRLTLHVSPREIETRFSQLRIEKAERRPERGYRGLYLRHVTQADAGCDFDFLQGEID